MEQKTTVPLSIQPEDDNFHVARVYILARHGTVLGPCRVHTTIHQPTPSTHPTPLHTTPPFSNSSSCYIPVWLGSVSLCLSVRLRYNLSSLP
mmetsp:Transcript_5009/g.7764  ORF Transcript_5009/g.7764 Transcript_5009/m.7764 type:complete len:92 (+) Transcript_5009:129-404(+)